MVVHEDYGPHCINGLELPINSVMQYINDRKSKPLPRDPRAINKRYVVKPTPATIYFKNIFFFFVEKYLLVVLKLLGSLFVSNNLNGATYSLIKFSRKQQKGRAKSRKEKRGKEPKKKKKKGSRNQEG